MNQRTVSDGPKRQLTLFDSTCIILGIIIGAAIYESTPAIAQNLGSPWYFVAIWLLGGLVSLIGALCFAELATAYPRVGGDYVFLSRAYGRRMGFLFAWAEYWIIRPGSIGAMAYVFGHYAQELFTLPLGRHQEYERTILALASVIVLTGIHLLGVRAGKWTQNLLTVVKVLGLLAIFAVGLLLVRPAVPEIAVEAAPAQAAQGNFTLAMIFVLFTFGGWNEMSFVAAEVRNPKKNIFRALVLGTVAITIIYVLVAVASIRALGFEGVQQTEALASEIVELRFANWGGYAVSLMICISSLGAITGMLFTGARIQYAMGTEHRLFAWLGQWSRRFDTPIRSLTVQTAIALALIVMCGPNKDAFERLVIFTTPVFWFFLMLVALSVFILRVHDPDTERPYRVFGYPITPALFCFSCWFMFDSSINYMLFMASQYEDRLVDVLGVKLLPEFLWAALILTAGVAVCLVERAGKPRPE